MIDCLWSQMNDLILLAKNYDQTLWVLVNNLIKIPTEW